MKLFTLQIICQTADLFHIATDFLCTESQLIWQLHSVTCLHTVTDKATRMFLKYNLLDLTDGLVMS